VLTILLRGCDPAAGGARNPHVLKYIPVPPLRPPLADSLSLQIVSTFSTEVCMTQLMRWNRCGEEQRF